MALVRHAHGVAEDLAQTENCLLILLSSQKVPTLSQLLAPFIAEQLSTRDDPPFSGLYKKVPIWYVPLNYDKPLFLR